MLKKITRREFLNRAGKISLAGTSAYSLGCVSSAFGSSLFNKLMQHSGSIFRTGKAVMNAMEDFTPEQEYYIGRTVGAVVVNKYKIFENPPATKYVNILGQTLAQASDLPVTFNGYHMLILDSDEINAFASPSGHIFVTRGMLGCCRNEGELAAVLAHEIGHVQCRHGINAIEKSRTTEALAVIGTEASRTFGDRDTVKLANIFEHSVKDITTTMINKGYSRSCESDADKSAVTIMERIGYNPASLIAMLEEMGTRLKPGGVDFVKTHPSPQSRIEDLSEVVTTDTEPFFNEVQQTRFQAAMENV